MPTDTPRAGALSAAAAKIAMIHTRVVVGVSEDSSIANSLEAIALSRHIVIDRTAPAADLARQAAKVLARTEWCVVPREPTEAMEAAGWIDKEDVCPCDIYRAMLAASPLAAAAPETEQSHAPR